MNKIKSNIIVGYFGMLMSISGIIQGTNPVLLFYVNNIMFFAYLAIIPYVFLYELTQKKMLVNTILLFVLFLVYEFLYSNIMFLIALISINLLILTYYLCRKEFSNIDFYKYTPFTFMKFNRYIGVSSLILLIIYFVINLNFQKEIFN